MYLDSHVHACASVSVFNVNVHLYGAFLVAQTDSKESASNAGDPSSIPESGRFPGEGNGYPLQYFFLIVYGQRSLMGYSPWGRKELDMTEQLTT